MVNFLEVIPISLRMYFNLSHSIFVKVFWVILSICSRRYFYLGATRHPASRPLTENKLIVTRCHKLSKPALIFVIMFVPLSFRAFKFRCIYPRSNVFPPWTQIWSECQVNFRVLTEVSAFTLNKNNYNTITYQIWLADLYNWRSHNHTKTDEQTNIWK